jgi:preprotein translocase subunit SecA
MEGGEPIYHPWLNKSIENAQKKVEERNFEIRKHLLDYDDVLNQQRKFIYEQRDAILFDKDLKNRVNDATAGLVGDMIDEFNREQKQDMAAAIKNLNEQLRSKFGYQMTPDQNEYKNVESLEKKIVTDLEKDINDKEALIGPDYLNMIIRDSYLYAIDNRWLDHLENMEALREAVYLRHYAQKNPLTEYKVEGFQIFDSMVDDIRQEIASRLHLVRFNIAPSGDGAPHRGASRPSRTITSQSASHSSMGSFSSAAGAATGGGAPGRSPMGSGAPYSGASTPDGSTVVRSQPKVGRNDPCPCGSGRKYKHCHGK